ncbi:MAG: DUF2156 domain-containing protein [Candidatus Eisenbacteria bacterium]|uniref:DUF2156 domain-containing protein n=1 Tax=Eiseniibacteriota bacterium TaxID=2212470 RepID=A0A849SKZ9_UNCEI|nr:DUF2156 domain-containing protein [Candidatus Eisenbacteria bacterium]
MNRDELLPHPLIERGHDLRASSSHLTARLLMAFALAAMGVVNLASAWLSHPPDRLVAIARLVPTGVLDTSRTFTLLAGTLMLVTAWGLRQGKRRAFVIALLLCAISVPVNVLKALDVEEAVVATGLMVALALQADAFRVRSRAPSVAIVRSGAVWGALALLAYMLVGSWIAGRVFGVEPSIGRAFADAAHQMFGIGGPVTLLPDTLTPNAHRVLNWYLGSLPDLTLVWTAATLLALLGPATHRKRHRDDAALARELFDRHGESPLAWFAVMDTQADYFFSRNRRAVLAYRHESDVALILGDPIGPADELPSLLTDFAAHCADGGWALAVFQARPEWLPLYRSLGWRALHIGEEPVLWTREFSLAGGAIGSVRRSARKASEAGVETQLFRPGERPFDVRHAPTGWNAELRAISAQWLAHHAGAEKSLGMGRFSEAELAEVWTAIAWNPTLGRVEAFLTWVPVPARGGWALDLMRRRADSVSGVMELLVVRTMEAAVSHGDQMLSLSLSALAKVEACASGAEGAESSPRRAAPDPERERLLEHLARFYDFKGLFEWKRKFDPRFEERFLVYPHPLALPAITLALVRAQSPGGLRAYALALFERKPAAA